MKRYLISWIVGVLVGAFLFPVGAGAVGPFNDETFNDDDWTHTVLDASYGSTASVSLPSIGQVVDGGNSYQGGVITWACPGADPGSPCASSAEGLFLWSHTFVGAEYNPATDGPIDTVNFSFGANVFEILPVEWGGAGAFAPLIKQGDDVYVVWSGRAIVWQFSGWNSLSWAGLEAADFGGPGGVDPFGGTGPDFSASGDPIQFGYLMAGSTSTDGRTATWGVDNWSVTVTSVAPPNQAPIADAGGPFEGNEGTAISLSGATASDPDGDSLTLLWTVDDPLCSFSDATALNPDLTCTDDGSYTVTLTVDDGAAAPVSDDATVVVSNVAPTITGVTGSSAPVAIGDQPVAVGVEWTDPGAADTHDVTWNWGDASIDDTQLGATSPAAQPHAYAEPGVYPVTVTLVDDDGGVDADVFEFVVIYDPSGGFVTGGGWIDSPEGAYPAEPTLTGRANFGFVSKYKKGASTPSGDTEFQFRAGDLNFHSDSYDWLVIAGSDRAKYKGTGSIDGAGDYGFMLTAVDNGNAGDTFRIKIWDIQATDTVVYDNKLGEDDTGYDGTAIGGGNIKVHKD